MCIAVPGTVIQLKGRAALVEIDGNRLWAEASLVDAREGDTVLVHGGCILQVLGEKEEKALMELMEELCAFWEEEP